LKLNHGLKHERMAQQRISSKAREQLRVLQAVCLNKLSILWSLSA
jgi:hypothetical protein